jgi:hypothetical protein
VNGREDERISYRKKTATCIPIATQNFTTNGTTSLVGNTAFNYTAASYGPNQVDLAMANDTILQNATYILPNFRNFTLPFHTDESSPYTIE